jgi:transglutaminase-like putative cysteine protease
MTLAGRFVATLWTVAALVPLTAGADGDTPFLATIAIERAPGSTGALTGPAVSMLHVTDPRTTAASLSGIDGLDVLGVDDATVRIRAAARPTIASSVTDRDRQSSWVVDFDEDTVQALLLELVASHDGPPTPAQLERFVFGHIANKSYSRSFDLASRVAASGEGDCTEHAVLLAALARASGYPARVVLGNLILELDTGLLAFGHAWTEIYDDGAWQIRDATLPGAEPSLRQVRYIPLGSLNDEGPSYVLSLVEIMSAMPVQISGVASQP